MVFTVLVANKAKGVYNISERTHLTNLGIILLDKEENVIVQDLLHTNIIGNRFKEGRLVDVEIHIHDI